MGHDVVSVSVESDDVAATEAALSGLHGLERVMAEPDGLALYVEDGPGQIAEIVRRLEREQIRTGAISVARPSLDDVFLKATGRRLEGQESTQPATEVRPMSEVLLLGRRATREIARYPEATIPTLFIPLFFLVVNIGQVSKTFPSSTPFLKGQGYVAFQLPVSLMFAVATATSGLALVTEIDLGYFDKLLVAPIRRSSIIFGRLTADLVRGIMTSALVLLVGLALGARIQTGVPGAIVIVLLSAGFGVAYAGLRAARRAAHAQRPGDPVELPAVLPAAVPDAELRAVRPALAADGDPGANQPGELRDRRTALAGDRRLEPRRAGASACS